MATKTRCSCCATLFLGSVVPCRTCKLACCAICKRGSTSCCKCAKQPCARTIESSMESLSVSVQSASSGTPDAQQDGFVHPVTGFGRRYAGVGSNGPALSEFETDSRWSWQPYQRFVKHVYQHQTKQLTGAEYRELATFTTDYGVDSPGWNGLTYDANLSLSPHPNYYQPEPIAAFQAPVNAPKPNAQDPPDALLEIKSAVASDPSSRFCYDAFWAPHGLEDALKFPFSFATVGTDGVHFYNKERVMTKEYRPAERIAAMVADSASESFIYLHQEAHKVTVGSLTQPDDIVLEFDLPKEYRPQAVGVIKTQSGNRCLIHGHVNLQSSHTVLVYDLETGKQTANLPIKRYDSDLRHPVRSIGAVQQAIVMDPVRTNVCYMGLLGDNAFAVVDTRMKRAARWIKVQDDIKYLTIQPYGACDKLVYSSSNHLALYDLTAGKARYQHSSLGTAKRDIAAVGLATYGEQIAVGRSNDDGPNPIISWLSWEKFESGSYFDTKKDSHIPGSGGKFLAVNSSGVYAMEHNHAMFAPWQSPLGGQSLVSQVKSPAANVSGVAPAQKGVRRAKREEVPDSFAETVNLTAPAKPQGFTKEYNHYEGLPAICETDRYRFQNQLWVAPGSEDPDKYPFSVLCAGSGGVNVYDHSYKFMGLMYNDKWGTTNAVCPHLATQQLVVASENGVNIFSFKNLFEQTTASISNLGYTPEAVTVMTRSSPQIVVGGTEVLLFDMESRRRISDVVLEHGGIKRDAWALAPDRSRPDVLYAMGLNHAFLIDLRINPKTAVRSFAPSKTNKSILSLLPVDYGACDKLLLSQVDQMSMFDIGSGKTLVEVEGTFGAAANYGTTLCVGSYEIGISYYDLENIAALPKATSDMHGSAVPARHTVGANRKGTYRKANDRLYFYPFKGIKL